MQLLAGPPVDLSDLYGQPIDTRTLREATDRLMDRITELLEEIRGEEHVHERFDPRQHGVPEIGDPMKRHEDIGRAAARRRREGERMTHVAVMGAGSWGTAFASLLAEAGCAVTMWARRQDVVDQINAGHNARLPARPRPARQRPRHGRPGGCVPGRRDRRPRGAVADPARPTSPSGVAHPRRARRRLPHEGRRARHDDAHERGHRARPAGIEEGRIVVALGAQPRQGDRPAASRQRASSRASTWRQPSAWRRRARRQVFRPYTDTDVVGTEICGATKNVVALAVGHGRGNGLRRQHQGDDHHPRARRDDPPGPGARAPSPQTFLGLAGVGDLIATCMSPLSRNHSFGVRWAVA